jgi:ADP-dependent NAD(P)H-hydrate dehydratase / NAD(P)H-hydrate epimerase
MNAILQYYTATQMRELHRLAIEEHHVSGFTLMQRAGRAAFDALLAQWPDTERLSIFCGTGNNGGDGFIIAALAVERGLRAEVYLFGNSASIKGDAQKALEYARKCQVPIHYQSTPPVLPMEPNMIMVDALLGTGLAGKVREPFRAAIEAINNSGLPVLAVDIPSGLCSDTGDILGVCVKATLTVTFIGRKIGMIRGEGPAMCGRVICDELGLPSALYRQINGASMHANCAD